LKQQCAARTIASFPLAHQDLHILSWFSIHIKTWMLFSAAELIGIAKKKTHFHLLDAINISGFAYAFALAASYELNTSSYLALPFQLIATINIA
jgi:hypothetical protein